MFFLIRTAFWISLLLLVLPFNGDPASDGPSAKDRASIDAMSALAAAGATVSDVGGFCERQPGACVVGAQALKIVGERAKMGASAIGDYLASDGKQAEADKPAAMPAAKQPLKVDARVTGSATSSRQTLTPSDRKPAWRQPAA